MKTRINLILYFILMCFSAKTEGQTQQEKIHQIRDISNRINKNTNLTNLTVEAEEYLEQTPDGGGSLTGHFDNKALVKIDEWIGLSYGTLETEYYFDKENLIFAFVRESHFQVADSGINQNKLKVEFEGQYYFEDNKIFKVIKKGSGFWDNGLDSNIPILENADTYSKLIKKKYNGS